MTINIQFGALAPELTEQLKQFSFTDEEKDLLKHYQIDMNAISRLYIRGILTDTEMEKCYKKLMKKVGELVKKHLKTKPATVK